MSDRRHDETPTTRRTYQREYARRKRERTLDRQRATAATCPFKQGRSGVCGAQLEIDTDRLGRTVSRCPRCERRLRGICQDCPRPVVGRIGSARRCGPCRKRFVAQCEARWRQRGGEALKDHERAQLRRRRADPTKRAHDLAVKKAWRQRNVVKIKLEKRKWRLDPNRPGGYSSREKWAAYHRAYREKHAARLRELRKRRYYELHPDRPHPVCACGCQAAIPWDGHGRPRKWLPGHAPWRRSLTVKEIVMSAAGRAIKVLEGAAEKIRKRLAGTEALQKELAAVERAVKELRTVATEDDAPKARRGKKAAA